MEGVEKEMLVETLDGRTEGSREGWKDGRKERRKQGWRERN